MNQKYRNFIMWALYGLLFLLAMLLQTSLLGRVRIFGVKVDLMPVVLVCITLQTGHESGGLFGLLAGFVWFAAGADDGILAIVSFTVFGILTGWLCHNLFPRRFVSSLILSFAALLCHEGAVFLLKFYLGGAPGSLFCWVPLTTLLSLPACPVFYLAAKSIGKAGGTQ